MTENIRKIIDAASHSSNFLRGEDYGNKKSNFQSFHLSGINHKIGTNILRFNQISERFAE